MAKNYITFSMGSKIFSLEKIQINPYIYPEDCKEDGLCQDCIQKWDTKQKKCICVDRTTGEDCGTRLPNSNFVLDDDCCNVCPESIAIDCANRGWSFLDSTCACNCDEESRINYSSWNPFADDIPFIKQSECPPGLWNAAFCSCECENLNNIIIGKRGQCYENQKIGPNCECYCDNYPDGGCGLDSKGRQGIWDDTICECIFPCGPGIEPHFCPGDTNGERWIICNDCDGENEYLGPCIDGLRHCCPKGYFYSSEIVYINPEYPGCVPCNQEYAPDCDGDTSRLNLDTCTCCPEGYVFLEGEGCVCKEYALNTCESPRILVFNTETEGCDCVCPENYIWYNSDCVHISNRCPEDGGNQLHTRWSTINERCECEIGNEFLNDCNTNQLNLQKNLNIDTCECECPDNAQLEREPWFYENPNNIECLCNEGYIAVNFTNGGDNLNGIFDNNCYTCEQLHGPNSFKHPHPASNYCLCDSGFIFTKVDTNNPILFRECISCAEYDINSISDIDGECVCKEGFSKVIVDNELGTWECQQLSTQTPEPTPPITPTPTQEPTTTPYP